MLGSASAWRASPPRRDSAPDRPRWRGGTPWSWRACAPSSRSGTSRNCGPRRRCPRLPPLLAERGLRRSLGTQEFTARDSLHDLIASDSGAARFRVWDFGIGSAGRDALHTLRSWCHCCPHDSRSLCVYTSSLPVSGTSSRPGSWGRPRRDHRRSDRGGHGELAGGLRGQGGGAPEARAGAPARRAREPSRILPSRGDIRAPCCTVA